MYIQMQKSHLIYVRKHGGALAHTAAKAMFVGSALLRGLFFGALSVVRRDAATKARIRLSSSALAFHLLGREPVS